VPPTRAKTSLKPFQLGPFRDFSHLGLFSIYDIGLFSRANIGKFTMPIPVFYLTNLVYFDLPKTNVSFVHMKTVNNLESHSIFV
jgi:hypothetical protein